MDSRLDKIFIESRLNKKGELVLIVKNIPFGHGVAMRETTYCTVDGYISHKERDAWFYAPCGRPYMPEPAWFDAWIKNYLNGKVRSWFDQEVSQ